MIISDEDYLAHYGIIRRSGRYPWGSTNNEGTPWNKEQTLYGRNRSFLDYISDMRRQGLTDPQIARGIGISTTQLRAEMSIAKNSLKQADISQAQRLKDKGYSNVAIGRRMNRPESSVRALLADGEKAKADILQTTANMLKDQVAEKKYIDIGGGVEQHIGISGTRLNTAVSMLQTEGYKVQYLKVRQIGTGKDTTMKVLTAPDVPYSEVFANRGEIQQIMKMSKDNGRTFLGIHPPLTIDPARVDIRYAEDGGAEADGVIYVRPGKDDVSLGKSQYAQVRIKVGDGHYLKGMAMYKDGLPDGVDLQFNTNKSDTGNKTDAMKPLKKDPDNPFGSTIKLGGQQVEVDSKGNEKVTSVMNKVYEEGDWSDWGNTLSSQMLSKQSPTLAKKQLDMTYEQRLQNYEEVSRLTNPTVRKKLLESLGDEADSAAVHLKAAALNARQGQHVILPLNSIPPTQIYAPNYRDGEKVVLIRHPHGGRFEIPELVVNNKNPEGKKFLRDARDAVGINPQVAERLSGADFDGDTVIVIPNNSRDIKVSPALEGLKNFDPQSAYPAYEGMPKMSPATKQMEMGYVSNLITDMTIKGASATELAKAVRHSMVVIDAEKHNLNYKLSAEENSIKQLKQKYQGNKSGGAATLISRAGSRVPVPDRKPRSMVKGGPIDRETGQRVYEETGASYVNKKGERVNKSVRLKRLSVTDDAHSLVSEGTGTRMERIYADHSNKLKALANRARKESVNTPRAKRSPSAAKTYAKEVASLNSKLTLAERNRPLERQAQVISNATLRQKRQANPDMTPEEVKKTGNQALAAARARTGAQKQRIVITPTEWEAIQAGAISDSKLSRILDNADTDKVRAFATPKQPKLMTSAKISRAMSMLASGYTRAEIADQLGVSISTLDLATVGGDWDV